MTEKKKLDPFLVWKDFYDKTEKNVTSVLHETLKTEAFSEWLGQVQSGYLQYQKFVQSTTDEYLKQMNMPTREEIANIASLIINVEEKVDTLEEKIEDEMSNAGLSNEISKLKGDISKLDKKLDQILTFVQTSQQQSQAEVVSQPSVEQKS